jgi:hypothetical protein
MLYTYLQNVVCPWELRVPVMMLFSAQLEAD